MATLLIHNANILSFHEGFTTNGVDTIAINGNSIEAIGRYSELKSLIQPNTNLIDAAGKTLMPGFNDSHIHIWKVGNLKTFMLDVRGVQSKEELLQQLSDYNNRNPHLQWITARGFNEAAWQEKALPTKNDLDRVTTSKPVYLIRTCAHIAVCNSKALALCNVSESTVVPAGGIMQLGQDGKPNGIFAETALGLISSHIPPYSKEDLKTMVKAARQEMYSYGITSATDPAVDPLLLQAYHEMNIAGEIGFRLNALPIILPDGASKPFPIPDKFESDFFKVNTVKFFADGGLSGQTAALKRSYINTSAKGMLRLNQGQYTSLCKESMQKELGVATHAIGDAAIEMAIDVYEQLHKDFPNALKRIEHLGLPEKVHLKAMAASNIACSMQAIFLSELGNNFIQSLDVEYLNQCYPVKSVLQHGVLMALSSDAPVVKNFNPFKGIAAAVSRKTNEGATIAAHESITVSEALKAYTTGAAAISCNKKTGAIKDGMLADFILIDKDPLTAATENIEHIKVLKTFVDGKEVWSR